MTDRSSYQSNQQQFLSELGRLAVGWNLVVVWIAALIHRINPQYHDLPGYNALQVKEQLESIASNAPNARIKRALTVAARGYAVLLQYREFWLEQSVLTYDERDEQIFAETGNHEGYFGVGRDDVASLTKIVDDCDRLVELARRIYFCLEGPNEAGEDEGPNLENYSVPPEIEPSEGYRYWPAQRTCADFRTP